MARITLADLFADAIAPYIAAVPDSAEVAAELADDATFTGVVTGALASDIALAGAVSEGSADRQRSSSRARVRYDDGTELVQNDWTNVGSAPWVGYNALYNSFSAGKLFSEWDSGDPTTVIDAPFAVAATETFRLFGIINVAATPVSPGNQGLYSMIGVKFDNTAAASVTGFIGVGVNELNQPVFRKSGAETSPNMVFTGATALPAGVYYATLDINANFISCGICNADRSVSYVTVGARTALSGSTVGQVAVINRDSRKATGNTIGALYAKKEASTARTSATVTANKAGPMSIYTAPAATIGESLRIMVPPSYDSRAETPLVLFCHGSGRTALDPGNTNTFDLLKALAGSAYGYLVAAPDIADSSWGNQASLDELVTAYRYMRDQFHIGPVLLLAASAGALTSLTTLAQRRLPGIAGWYGMYPVTNLAYQYNNSATHKANIKTAYGFSSDADYASFTAGFDPQLRGGVEFRRVPMRMSASLGDTVVDAVNNAQLFAAKVAGYASEATVVMSSGDHGESPQTDIADVSAFFARCLGTA